MKQPKKLTRDQKESLSVIGLIPSEWMLVEEFDFYIKVIHKKTGKTKMVDKYLRKRK